MKEVIRHGVTLEKAKIKLGLLALLILLFAMPKSLWAGVAVPDHYKCYDVLWMSGRGFFSSFFPPRFFLEDEFESKEAKILGAETFCNPVDKNEEGITDDTAHLTCYEIKNSGFSFFSPVREVSVDNQFGEQDFIVAGARNLCVPSEKNNEPSDLLINHYKCYNIIDSDPFLVPRIVDLADQFEEKSTLLLAPKLFCNPVLEKRDKNGVVIDIFVDETAHLTCYDIFDERERFIFVKASNQIDELLKLLLGKPEFLCVPNVVEVDPCAPLNPEDECPCDYDGAVPKTSACWGTEGSCTLCRSNPLWVTNDDPKCSLLQRFEIVSQEQLIAALVVDPTLLIPTRSCSIENFTAPSCQTPDVDQFGLTLPQFETCLCRLERYAEELNGVVQVEGGPFVCPTP